MKQKPDYIINDRPIAIYDTQNKQLIGVFSTLMYVVKYLRPESPQQAYSTFMDALLRGGCVRKTIFNFRVALRFANEAQVEQLNGCEVIIAPNYPPITNNKLLGYTSTREQLWIKLKIKMSHERP